MCFPVSSWSYTERSSSSVLFVLYCVLLHSMWRFKRRMWEQHGGSLVLFSLSLTTTQDVVDSNWGGGWTIHTQTNNEQTHTQTAQTGHRWPHPCETKPIGKYLAHHWGCHLFSPSSYLLLLINVKPHHSWMSLLYNLIVQGVPVCLLSWIEVLCVD